MSLNNGQKRWLATIVVTAAILLVAAVRWRLRDMPLERDEGEYAYAGQLMLKGIPPYQQAYNMKLPGTYAAYAAMLRVFGETPSGIHTGLLLVNACTTALVFLVGRRLHGGCAGAAGGAVYGLLSCSESVMGLSAHATHFVALMAMAGIWSLLLARDSGRARGYLAAGLCMGLAFVMKQPGMVFVVFGALEVFRQSWERPASGRKVAVNVFSYMAGAVAPYVLTCLLLYRAGVFGRFWFWTVQYARQYATLTTASQGVEFLKLVVPKIFLTSSLIWCFALLGVVAVVLEKKLAATWSLELNLLFWSLVGVSAGLYFRDHYFILLLPATSLLAGWALQWSSEELRKRPQVSRLAFLPAVVFVAGCGDALFTQRADFFQRTSDEVIRQRYGGNPFPEAVEFGRYIRDHSEPDAKIGILGSEPEIFFYAERRSATGHIYMYGLMEEQKYARQMQAEMEQEVEQAKPEYMVKVLVPGSWLRKPNSDPEILEWGERYIAENYQVVGIADISKATVYRWEEAAQGYIPKSRYSMYLYKRKS